MTMNVMIIGGVVLIVLAEEGRRVVLALLRHRTAHQEREHAHRMALTKQDNQTRRIEALALMDVPARNRLLESMPDWLDRDDPADVEAWKEARVETLQIQEKLR